MTESNLPALKDRNPPAERLRTKRLLLVGGVIATAGAVSLFVLTHYLIFSALLAIAGTLFLGARLLILKSLALTATTANPLLGSTHQRLEALRKQVSKAKFLENVEVEGAKAADQADRLLQQYKSLRAVLSLKFEPTEVTFTRYLEGIETSCLAIGENLAHAEKILSHLSITAGKEREQVFELLRMNDEALNELAVLFNSLNAITTKEKHRDQLEQSMRQIKELAERAKNYSRH